MIEQLPVTALHEWLADGGRAAPLILDVREPWETVICQLAQAQLLPMQEIPSRWNELPHDRDIVVAMPPRHAQPAGRRLSCAKQGLNRLYNLTGGIAAWAEQVDPAMARY